VVVIPSSKATELRQTVNAAALASVGAGRVVEEADAGGRLDDRLSEVLADLLTDGTERRQLSSAISGFAHPDAAKEFAAALFDVAGRKSLSNVA
jgi:UDP-N-acetylglucosamine:LPS N-acetylglucosamine transferase